MQFPNGMRKPTWQRYCTSPSHRNQTKLHRAQLCLSLETVSHHSSAQSAAPSSGCPRLGDSSFLGHRPAGQPSCLSSSSSEEPSPASQPAPTALPPTQRTSTCLPPSPGSACVSLSGSGSNGECQTWSPGTSGRCRSLGRSTCGFWRRRGGSMCGTRCTRSSAAQRKASCRSK